MKCARHPKVETSLRCGKCGKPICPKCMVQTPVGARCPECARLYKLPTYRVSTSYYLKAIGSGLGMALACGLLWGFIGKWSPFYLNLLLAPGAGYAIGAVISRSVNRKRGTGLAVVAGIAVVMSYLVSLSLFGGFPFILFNILFLLIDLAALALGIFVAANFLR
ncbi:B-box zinc finger protein [Chloroflexota bacterium]